MFEVCLFCFPFAGGAAKGFDGLAAAMPAWLKVRAMDLPAHGTRRGEPVLQRWDAVVADCRGQVDRHLGGQATPYALPYALLGHSMGALVATEVAHAMAAAGRPPLWLGVAGTERVPRRDGDPDWLTCPDARVIERLRELHGTPPELLANAALMEILLPVLRADLALCATYAAPPRPPLSCPLMALGGTLDDVSDAELQAWQVETAADFEVRMVAGDHFFVTQAPETVAAIVSAAVARAATGSGSARR